jgi:hypothetical protein
MDLDREFKACVERQAARRARVLGGDRDDLRCVEFDQAASASETAPAEMPSVDLARAILFYCVPAMGKRLDARDLARNVGRRVVAVMYAARPDVFRGHTDKDLASALGVKDHAWREQISAVKRLLAVGGENDRW